MSTLEDRAHDARQDRIADDQAQREAAQLRADRNGFEVGDIVTRSARGKQWRITGFWNAAIGDQVMATLEPLVGYTSASHPVDQLRAVTP